MKYGSLMMFLDKSKTPTSKSPSSPIESLLNRSTPSNRFTSSLQPKKTFQSITPIVTPKQDRTNLPKVGRFKKDYISSFNKLEKQIKGSLITKENQFLIRTIQQIHSDKRHKLFNQDFSVSTNTSSIQNKRKRKHLKLFKVRPEDSTFKVISAERKYWLKKHTKGLELKHSFIQKLYEQLDYLKEGYIGAEYLFEVLVSLGFTSNPSFLESCLKYLLKADELSSTRIPRKVFLNLFGSDSLCDVLENMSKHLSKKNTSFDGYFDLIRKMWDKLKDGNNRLSFSSALNFFDRLETNTEVKTQLFHFFKTQRLMKLIDFQHIFVRPVIAKSISLLEDKVGDKILEYTRLLFLSGIKCYHQGITTQQGEHAISAFKSYLFSKNYALKSESLEEFRANIKDYIENDQK